MASGPLSIKLRCSSWQQLATIYKRDLCRGSMFLKASTPPPIGTDVTIDLMLPSSSVVTLTGTVREHVKDPQRGEGVQLALQPIPAHSVWLIENALAAEVKRTEGAPPPAAASGSAPAPSPAPAPPAPRPSAARAEPPGPAISEGADMVAAEQDLMKALAAEAESMKKLNPFLVLGIGYDATDAQVRAAFGELTKRYHPDLFARFESTQLRQVAAEIFILIRDAYRKLSDQGGRTAALAALGKGPKAAAAARATPLPPSLAPAPPPLSKAAAPKTGEPARDSQPELPTVRPNAPIEIPREAMRTEPPGAMVPGSPADPRFSRPAHAPTVPAPNSSAPGASPGLKGPAGAKRPARIDPGGEAGGENASQGRPSTPRIATPPQAVAKPPAHDPPREQGRRPSDPPPARSGTPSVSQSAPMRVEPTQPLPPVISEGADPSRDPSRVDVLLEQGKFDDAIAECRAIARKHPNDRAYRAAIEVCEGLRAMANRDRMEGAQRFEAALEIDPANERAARELAEMRRQATNERKGLLTRLMGKKD